MHQNTKVSSDSLVKSPTHAIAVEGKNGSGKKYLARYIAGRILNQGDINTHPYTMILDCENKIGIDDVREAIKFLSLAIPGNDQYKRCLIFYSFEKLSPEGQNSLLKSLEEPPADTLIILTTESKALLPPTIASRVSWLNILPVDRLSCTEFFKNEYSLERINNAFAIADGRVGLMKELLENYDEHPLVFAIKKAKETIVIDKFERLASLDKLIKSDGADMKLYFWAMTKILRAAFHNQLEKTGTVNKRLLMNLKIVASAQNAQKYNVNQKALLTELFYSL